MMAKYLATSLAMLNVVSAPRVISSCLPTSTISISFAGCESRSTMLPASLAACVPVFIATPTSACASAGASLVPSPVIATRRPPPCCSRISRILASGVACARKSSTPDFLAQATPAAKMRLIREHQGRGRLDAMTGDGTNDPPTLAQADVGVAMNTGTQAAKEAGNMVDLDSNPTKLIEIVEVGKQLLMTRGALTTCSIANDVAKYFAIIPAVFVVTYPQLQALNVMGLSTPHSAVLSAVIFNALIIVALIPLALRGVKYRPLGAAVILRRNLIIYGLGGIILPFVR